MNTRVLLRLQGEHFNRMEAFQLWQLLFVSTSAFARTWGAMKSNRTEEMNYEKISRAMRYHYGSERNGRKGHLAMVRDRRLCYRWALPVPILKITFFTPSLTKEDLVRLVLHFDVTGLESLLWTGDLGRLMSSLAKIMRSAKLVSVSGPRSNNLNFNI